MDTAILEFRLDAVQKMRFVLANFIMWSTGSDKVNFMKKGHHDIHDQRGSTTNGGLHIEWHGNIGRMQEGHHDIHCNDLQSTTMEGLYADVHGDIDRMKKDVHDIRDQRESTTKEGLDAEAHGVIDRMNEDQHDIYD